VADEKQRRAAVAVAVLLKAAPCDRGDDAPHIEVSLSAYT
jgi:hypothetical protein